MLKLSQLKNIVTTSRGNSAKKVATISLKSATVSPNSVPVIVGLETKAVMSRKNSLLPSTYPKKITIRSPNVLDMTIRRTKS